MADKRFEMVANVRDNTGRFHLRPHYQPNELDLECERLVTKFLKDRKSLIDFPISTDDLTVLIEEYAKDLDSSCDLSSYGPEVEGVTLFQSGSKPRVKISKHFIENPNLENRYRTTLAHEFGHVHFHAYLFSEDRKSADMFRSNEAEKAQICKRESILNAKNSDWMEWQAGYVSGAILMPKSHIIGLVNLYMIDNDLKITPPVESVHANNLQNLVSKKFRVSLEAAKVRLSQLRLIGGNQGQIKLL